MRQNGADAQDDNSFAGIEEWPHHLIEHRSGRALDDVIGDLRQPAGFTNRHVNTKRTQCCPALRLITHCDAASATPGTVPPANARTNVWPMAPSPAMATLIGARSSAGVWSAARLGAIFIYPLATWSESIDG